jgi:hypothetical protein
MSDAQVEKMIKLLGDISRELKHATLLLELIHARMPDADEYADALLSLLSKIKDATHAHSD